MKIVTWALAAPLLFVGCAAPGPATDGSPDARDLDGRRFVSRSVSGRTLVPGTEIRLSFGDGQVGATAGCNSMGAPYRIEDGTLVLGPDGISMTEIGCDPARHEQDDWLLTLLASSPTLTLDGDDLVLAGDGSTITLIDREVADPDRALVGTVWQVDTVIEGDAASSVPTDGAVTLTFPDETTFEVRADGCAVATGSVEIWPERLVFDDFTVEATACPSPWTETIRVLREGDVSYDIDADRLSIEAERFGVSMVQRP